jgi:hypothetical protein
MPTLRVVKGDLQFEFTADGPKSMQELIKQAAFVSEWPNDCPICSASVFLAYRSPSGNDYYSLQCNGSPAHEVNLHELKEDKGMYYKPEEWQVAYKDRNKDGQSQNAPATSSAPATSAPATAPSAPTSTVSDTGPVMNATKAKLIKSIAAQKGADIEVIATAMCSGKPFDQCNERDGDTILAALNSL